VKEEPTPPGKIARHLAPGVEEYILRMIARDPDERFHSCDEALEALEEITGQHCSARADGRHVVLADQAPHKKTSPRAGERKPEPPLAQIMRHTFEVSLVYAEIGGFSKFMERRATLDVTDFLAQFSARMEECWFGADGKIIDSRGTRIIVAFDNIRNDDQAGRAIISARDMRERFAALRRERGERVEELSLKIGIFTEEVTREFFEDESSRERESLLHGAQRLQKLDSGLRDSILMCERTFTSAGDSFPAKLYKSTYLGGRREPIRVFSLA
jgi:class 3 adenylate cyclase